MVGRKYYLCVSIFIIILLVAVFSGCINIIRESDNGQSEQSTSQQSAMKPMITQFSAIPNTVNPGQSATLTWAVTNAESVTIEPGIGVVALSGSTAVSPSTLTKYTITATNSSGRSTATTEVIVGTASASEIPEFPSSPSHSQSSSSSEQQLPSSPEPSAPYSVAPFQFPNLTPGTPPQIVSFTANPASIQSGSSSTLTWNVSNANSVTLNGEVVSTSGTKQVSPAATTTFELTATNAWDTTAKSVTITVSGSFPDPWESIGSIDMTPDEPLLIVSSLTRLSKNNYEVKIYNMGDTNVTESFRVELKSGSLWTYRTVTGLNSHQSKTINIYNFPQNCTGSSSTFDVVATVDSLNQITEPSSYKSKVLHCDCLN